MGTLNYMPPEAIKDTSSNGKPGSKVRRLLNVEPRSLSDRCVTVLLCCLQISAKGDVWSLGCILYCMTYGKTPFQSITNQISKIHAIVDPSHEIDFPHIPEKDLLDVLKVSRMIGRIITPTVSCVVLTSCLSVVRSFQRCLVRNPRERISIAELLDHPYLQLQSTPEPGTNITHI